MRNLMLFVPLILCGCGPSPEVVRLTNASYDNGVLCAVYAHDLYVHSNLLRGVNVGCSLPYEQWKVAAANIPGSVPSMNKHAK